MLLRATGGGGRGSRRAGRRLWPAVVLGAALALAAAVAQASEPTGRITSPGDGARLVPGSVVEVAWTPLPSGVEEFELLLYLGEDAASVRLTDQLDPALRSFRWPVPNLPSARARLAIRFNRGRGEEPGPESALFEIGAARGTEPQPVVFRDGELWAAAPFTQSWQAVPSAPTHHGRPADPSWSAPETALLRSCQDGSGEPRAPARLGAQDGACAAAPPSRPALSRSPLDVPLRD